MSLVKGPFNIKWGDNVIQDIEEVAIDHTIDSEDFETVQGRTIEVDGPYKVTVTLTLLAADIPALAAILPQHFVPNGGMMSTGETVQEAQGAIDVVPSDCDSETIFNDLDIEACGNPGQVLRVVNTRTKIDSMELDNKLMKVAVKFVGESTEATVQMFMAGGINVVS